MRKEILWATYNNAQMNLKMKNQHDGKSITQMKATAHGVKKFTPFVDESFDRILDTIVKNYIDQTITSPIGIPEFGKQMMTKNFQ